MKTILTIGGTDPSGCAGLEADGRTVSALGEHAASVVTAITAQNTQTVGDVWTLPEASLRGQLSAVLSDLQIDAVKVGLLGTDQSASLLAELLGPLRVPLVLDPVTHATTGPRLQRVPVADLLEPLYRHIHILTPNALEARALTGIEVQGPSEAEKAGRILLDRGASAVLVKGGHFVSERGADVLVTGERTVVFPPLPASTQHNRGTGCALASALAVYLARGLDAEDAVALARLFVARGRDAGYGIGGGEGPMDACFTARPGYRRTISRLGRLHVIADRSFGRLSQIDLAAAALAEGADVIQIRNKGSESARALTRIASEVRALCRSHRAQLIIDDRADVARAVEADGVHVGRDDATPEVARCIVGPEALVGVTANHLDEARAAQSLRADYLGVGPVFPTSSKAQPAPVLGLEGLREIVGVSRLPVIAIGGVTPERVAEVMGTGAYGIAVLSGVSNSEDPKQATRAYASALREAMERAT